jgi:dipeptidyl aminopeptidase/acylaminoacyl peptidase
MASIPPSKFPFPAVPLILSSWLLLIAGSAAQENPQPKTLPPSYLSNPHPFGVHDMVRMERVGTPLPSPDGKWIVFTVRAWDADANKATTNLWLVSADGGAPRQLTSAKYKSDSSPVWSPDSRTVAFISNRSSLSQIWSIALDGGEATQLTTFAVDVDNLRWSPAGSHLAFAAEVYPDADMKTTAERDKAKADNPVKATKFNRLFVRHWDAWEDGKRSHIFALPVKKDKSSAWQSDGEPLDLMKGVDADCPTKPFGGSEEFAFSPDGKEIAYTAQLPDDIAWSTDLNIYTVAINGGASKLITAANKATDTGPVYSPDGKSIAYRAMARPGFESDRYRVTLYDRTSGKSNALTEAWDRSPSSLDWSPDGKTLLAAAGESAREKIFQIDAANGEAKAIVSDHYNTGALYFQADRNAKPRIVFSQDSLTAPADIFVANSDGSAAKQLTHFNDERMKLAKVSEPAEFHFTGALGEKVQAWILKPVDFVAGKKYPVAFIIHGGPQGAIEDHFHYRWNPQAFAGAGCAVIAVNFHGSTGFGQAFTDSISGDWGGKPYEDLMKGLDYALANYDWLDSNRVAALGASYGGWMINWINGHTKRFKCLVNHDGGFDEFANYFTTEELWFPEWEFKGLPWEKPELYDKFSPSRYIKDWRTPTLVIHGANDFRLVDAEGIATFTALQRRGVPSQMLYFPDENHWILKPKNSIVWHETILAWLEKWLK